MAWQQTEPFMNQKTQFAFRAKSSANFNELCCEYGISTKTGCKSKPVLKATGRKASKKKVVGPRAVPRPFARRFSAAWCGSKRATVTGEHASCRSFTSEAGGKPRAKAA
jgi:hypothetical protein